MITLHEYPYLTLAVYWHYKALGFKLNVMWWWNPNEKVTLVIFPFAIIFLQLD